MDFCVDLEDERVSFSGAGSHGTSEKSGTLSVKLGSAPWESVTAHFARLPAGIDMILGLDNGLNKVDVTQREARVGPTDFVFLSLMLVLWIRIHRRLLLPYLGWVKFWRSTLMFLLWRSGALLRNYHPLRLNCSLVLLLSRSHLIIRPLKMNKFLKMKSSKCWTRGLWKRSRNLSGCSPSLSLAARVVAHDERLRSEALWTFED